MRYVDADILTKGRGEEKKQTNKPTKKKMQSENPFDRVGVVLPSESCRKLLMRKCVKYHSVSTLMQR